jgi:hypothetical protein
MSSHELCYEVHGGEYFQIKEEDSVGKAQSQRHEQCQVHLSVLEFLTYMYHVPLLQDMDKFVEDRQAFDRMYDQHRHSKHLLSVSKPGFHIANNRICNHILLLLFSCPQYSE